MTGESRIEPAAMRTEIASLFNLLGGMGAKHLLLVGGLVPPMLVAAPIEPHVGSADIDICLSIAFTAGATRQYYKSIEETIDPYFQVVPGQPFRWRKRAGAPGLPLLVDFLAPESAEDVVQINGTRELQQSGPRSSGPVGYAIIARPDAAEGSDEHEQARLSAFAVVSEVIDLLIDRIDWRP